LIIDEDEGEFPSIAAEGQIRPKESAPGQAVALNESGVAPMISSYPPHRAQGFVNDVLRATGSKATTRVGNA
jgi:hypothetical protein